MNALYELADSFIIRHPATAARVLESFPAEDSAALLATIPLKSSTGVLSRMDTHASIECLLKLQDEQNAKIFAEMPIQLGATIMRRFPREKRDAVLAHMVDADSRALRLLLTFPEGTVGALMDPLCFVVPDDVTVEEAVERVRARESEPYFYYYVINRDHGLSGVVSVRDLLVAPQHLSLKSVVSPVSLRLSPYTDHRSVLSMEELAQYQSLPVISEEGLFLGVIKLDTFAGAETGASEREAEGSIRNTGAALGELYRIWLSGLLYSVENPSASNSERRKKG